MKELINIIVICCAGYPILLEDVEKRCGLNHRFVIQCSECKVEHRFSTSDNIFQGQRAGKSAAINRAAALAASEVGLGRVGLEDLTTIMGLPQPSEPRSYRRHLKRVAKSSDEVRRYLLVIFSSFKFISKLSMPNTSYSTNIDNIFRLFVFFYFNRHLKNR